MEVAGDSPADSVASREDYTAVHLHHLLGRGDAHSHLPDSAARKAEQEPPVVSPPSRVALGSAPERIVWIGQRCSC